MKLKHILLGALAALIAIPSSSQVVLKGNVINAYAKQNGHWEQVGNTYVPGVGTVAFTGLYSLTLGQQGSDYGVEKMEQVYTDNLWYGTSGAVHVNGYYYTFFASEKGFEDGSYLDDENGDATYALKVRKWSTQTGELVDNRTIAADYNATDLTYDPADNRVYGVFNMLSSSGGESQSGYRFGWMDMDTYKVTSISKSDYGATEIRAVAASPDGKIYGIDTSGEVYTISKTDGTLTRIGNIGFKTQRRMMTATCDFRDGTLYFIGFKNDGKIDPNNTSGTNNTLSVDQGGRDTGLYTIDTKTGKATLIADMPGKEQFVGLYVEGGEESSDKDLKVDLTSVPEMVKLGDKGTTFLATVTNVGKQDADASWIVALYCDGRQVATKTGSALKPGESKDIYMIFTPTNPKPESDYYAELTWSEDQVARNNRTDIFTIALQSPAVPAVNIDGVYSQTSGVTLMWNAPRTDGVITDGAEDYAPFIIKNIGDWYMYDADKSDGTYGMTNWMRSIDFPHQYSPKAFIVFNPAKAGLDATSELYAPHNGNQVFMSQAEARLTENGTDEEIASDNWMISPLLNGEAQTIKFWAKSYALLSTAGSTIYEEKIKVLANTTDEINPEAFTVVKDTEIVPYEWTEYSVDLPAGTKHFAINCVSDLDNEHYFLYVDDITYQGKPFTLKGYNVYKNNEKVNQEPLAAVVYTDQTATAADIYNVTAVYEEGESRFSNTYGFDLAQAITPATPAQDNAPAGIYNLRGQKMQSASAPGIYIIRSGNTTKKVVVK